MFDHPLLAALAAVVREGSFERAAQSLASFAAAEPALLDLSVDDQAHTADRLRAGEVVAAITALDAPVQGCRSVPLGRLRYRATASPAFMARHFADGVGAGSLRRAPCLVFDRKDRLQSQWVEAHAGADLPTPRHWLPSSQAFVDASLAGLGWGLNPEPLVRQHLEAGTLVELVPDTPLDVPLYWQHARSRLPMLDRLTDSVVRAAREALQAA